VSDLPPPRQPYRNAVLVHGALAGAILVVAWATGGDLRRAVIVAAIYFVAATAWTWFRFRQRESGSAQEEGRGARGDRP
jgi:hypothetical protein